MYLILSFIYHQCEKVSPSRLHLDFQNSCVGPAPSGLLGALDVIVQRNLKLWLDLPWGTQGEEVTKAMGYLTVYI